MDLCGRGVWVFFRWFSMAVSLHGNLKVVIQGGFLCSLSLVQMSLLLLRWFDMVFMVIVCNSHYRLPTCCFSWNLKQVTDLYLVEDLSTLPFCGGPKVRTFLFQECMETWHQWFYARASRLVSVEGCAMVELMSISKYCQQEIQAKRKKSEPTYQQTANQRRTTKQNIEKTRKNENKSPCNKHQLERMKLERSPGNPLNNANWRTPRRPQFGTRGRSQPEQPKETKQ